MPGDAVRVRLVQAQQVAANGRIELGRLDVVGQIGFVRTCVATLRCDAFAPTRRAESTFTTATAGRTLAAGVAGPGSSAVTGVAPTVAATTLVATPLVATPLVTAATVVAIAVAALAAGTVTVLPTAVVAATRTILAATGAIVASGAFPVGTVAAIGTSVVAAAIAAVSALVGAAVVAVLGTTVVAASRATVLTALRTPIIAARGTSIVTALGTTVVVTAGRTSAGFVAALPARVAAPAFVAVARCTLAATVVGAFVALLLAARPRSGSSTPEGPTFTVAVGHRKILS